MEKNMKKKIIYFVKWPNGHIGISQRVYFAMLLVLLFLISGCGEEEEGILLTENLDDKEVISSETSYNNSDLSKDMEKGISEEKRTKNFIYVQVSGAVVNPGVYSLEEGSRIFQAIELAGGITETADTKKLNQAEPLTDGQMIYVMNYEEAAVCDPSEVPQKDDRIILNTATEAELTTLPGIGTAKAKSILAWREENGSFQQIEDLMKIEGIKTGVFSKIKDSIKVD